MLAAARARTPQIEYVRGDAKVTIAAGPWDAVTAFYCIQYLEPDVVIPLVMRELAPGGTFAIATFPHRHFAETEWAAYFPSLPAIDMARFPSVPALTGAFRRASSIDVEVRDLAVRVEDDPAALIARVEAKFLSSFFLLSDAEFQAGLAAMRRDWRGRPVVSRTTRAAIISGRRAAGVR
jgi:hypothetical protein